LALLAAAAPAAGGWTQAPAATGRRPLTATALRHPTPSSSSSTSLGASSRGPHPLRPLPSHARPRGPLSAAVGPPPPPEPHRPPVPGNAPLWAGIAAAAAGGVALLRRWRSNVNPSLAAVAISLAAAGTAAPGSALGAGPTFESSKPTAFDAAAYSGRWYEIASLKEGFAGEGQRDCHCTQGLYKYDPVKNALTVDTFCVHGSPTGNVTGIRGRVTCVDPPADAPTMPEGKMVLEKCSLRFPAVPIIPPLPYEVLRTDYTDFALVSGARNRSFVQVYSRVPDPGKAWLDSKLAYLATLGYDPARIVPTPQDCDKVMAGRMADMEAAMDQGDDPLTGSGGVRFGGALNPGRVLKDFETVLAETLGGF